MRTLYQVFSAACLSLMLVACSGGSPEDTAKTFIEKSYKGDAEAVLKMVHLPDADTSKPGVRELAEGKVRAAVAAQHGKAEARGGVDSITAQPFQPSAKDDKRGRVELEVRFHKGQTEKNSVKLIKTDDGWKIGL